MSGKAAFMSARDAPLSGKENLRAAHNRSREIFKNCRPPHERTEPLRSAADKFSEIVHRHMDAPKIFIDAPKISESLRSATGKFSKISDRH